jgi:ribonuclease BN (tRNA processing enzyme)
MRSPYYPIPMHAMAAHIRFVELSAGSVFALPGATVEASVLNHPGRSLGYRLSAEGHVLVYATDTEPFGSSLVTQHLVEPPPLLHLMQHADLLIHDAQYTPEEYPPHLGWGHSTYVHALQAARKAEVKQLVLYHHDPSHSDAVLDCIVATSQTWIKRRHLPLTCLAAAEGIQLRL